MLGSTLLGRTLAWHGTSDPPGGWAYSVDDLDIAELEWSRDEGLVRAESDSGVWRVRPFGGFLLRCVVSDAEEEPRLVYAGSVGRGLMESREGRRFVLFSQASFREGPWLGIDDAEGTGVLRMRTRFRPGPWMEVAVTPDPTYARHVAGLLVLWGALRILESRRPWLRWAVAATSERNTQRVLDELVASVAF